MEEYEEAMKLNVIRPVTVTGVTRTTMGTFIVETDCLLGGAPAHWECRAVISGKRCTSSTFHSFQDAGIGTTDFFSRV